MNTVFFLICLAFNPLILSPSSYLTISFFFSTFSYPSFLLLLPPHPSFHPILPLSFSVTSFLLISFETSYQLPLFIILLSLDFSYMVQSPPNSLLNLCFLFFISFLLFINFFLLSSFHASSRLNLFLLRFPLSFLSSSLPFHPLPFFFPSYLIIQCSSQIIS